MKPIYRRMLNLMEQKRKTRKPVEPWYLYILQCRDGTFYTGITKDLARRLQQHQDGKASRYTRTRRPVKLLYHEPCRDRTQALLRECAVKALSRKSKEKLVARTEPE